ncbi:MAG: hypothetical protein ACR2PH_12835 [Desulfobulbia bacterium]
MSIHIIAPRNRPSPRLTRDSRIIPTLKLAGDRPKPERQNVIIPFNRYLEPPKGNK